MSDTTASKPANASLTAYHLNVAGNQLLRFAAAAGRLDPAAFPPGTLDPLMNALIDVQAAMGRVRKAAPAKKSRTRTVSTPTPASAAKCA